MEISAAFDTLNAFHVQIKANQKWLSRNPDKAMSTRTAVPQL